MRHTSITDACAAAHAGVAAIADTATAATTANANTATRCWLANQLLRLKERAVEHRLCRYSVSAFWNRCHHPSWQHPPGLVAAPLTA
jgi:hypothetical protein